MDAKGDGTDLVPGLRSLDLAPEYRRGHRDLVSDFYVPCLEVSRTYLRAAGYFTSQSLALVAAGLPAFIAHDGQMHLLASPYLDAEDIAALERGVAARMDVIERALLRAFDTAGSDEIVRDRLGFLAWLVAEGRLDVRIGLTDSGAGLYHEKYGVFVDAAGDAVAFTGSPNETRGGLETNFESIDVFESWTDEGFRVQLKQDAFAAAWSGRTTGLQTVTLPDAVRRRLLQMRPAAPPVRDPLGRSLGPAGPSAVHARDYQLEAGTAWARAGYRGVLEMATGTGKTITALLAARDYIQQSDQPTFLVIAAPYVHLVDQWDGEMQAFGFKPTLGYGASSRWLADLRRAASDLKIGLRMETSCVLTHDALRSPGFRKLLASMAGHARTALIADEVHNLGASRSIAALSELDFTARLGLSATPARWSDEETDALFAYFGPVVYEFPLSKAIAEHYLVPYSYFPHFVELADDEMGAYMEVSRKLARLAVPRSAPVREVARIEDIRGYLLRERSAILNNAVSKLPAFQGVLARQASYAHTLVYTTPERIDETVKTVSRIGGRMVHRFTYRESAGERRRLMELFASGEVSVLVAIRCLDEGVDIPQTETAFILASSSNSREFIQRRGRILRRAPGKASAVIHDFLAVPSGDLPDDEVWKQERAVMKRELTRFTEFASLATNRFSAEEALVPLQKKYSLFDL